MDITEHLWDLIDSYFQENRGLQSQAIASFNRFVKETLPSIIARCGSVSVDDQHNNLCKVFTHNFSLFFYNLVQTCYGIRKSV